MEHDQHTQYIFHNYTTAHSPEPSASPSRFGGCPQCPLTAWQASSPSFRCRCSLTVVALLCLIVLGRASSFLPSPIFPPPLASVAFRYGASAFLPPRRRLTARRRRPTSPGCRGASFQPWIPNVPRCFPTRTRPVRLRGDCKSPRATATLLLFLPHPPPAGSAGGARRRPLSKN